MNSIIHLASLETSSESFSCCHTLGETDDYCYNIVEDPVHVHDLQATILHCMGIDHKKLTFKFQGRHHRLTDVQGNVVRKLLG